jgi:FlaA1/EpsC-like NDP-sugar epimerase
LVLQAGAYAEGGEIFVLDMGEPVKILSLAENLIRLSGYEPYTEIPITFTGLRPGEKLYEELLMEEEGMRSTANKKIHIGRSLQIDEAHLRQALAQLSEAVVRGDASEIRALIKELVPTYHRGN